jgi:hypothetical protein
VAEGFPKDPNAPKLVRDRKTGKQYDPNKEFEKKMTSPEVMAQMKRMAKKEGVAEGLPKSQDNRYNPDGSKKPHWHELPFWQQFAKDQEKERQEQMRGVGKKKVKEQGVAEGFDQNKLRDLEDKYDELDYDGNSESDREQMRFIQQQIRDLKKNQSVAEGSKEKTPGVALSKAYKKDFDGNKPGHNKPETALTGTYSKTGKPGGELKKQGVAESHMSELDAEYQDYKKLSPREFFNMYRVTKQQWFEKYKIYIRNSLYSRSAGCGIEF